jgi:hypothetical protein
MRKLKYLSFGILLFPCALFAGQIYGSVTSAGHGVARANIEINCNNAVASGTTSSDGSYRINVPQQGQCTLTLIDYPGRPSAVVFSYPDPSQYDFELVAGPSGTYQLRRR